MIHIVTMATHAVDWLWSAGSGLADLNPVYYLVDIFYVYAPVISDRLVVSALSVVLGMFLMLFLELAYVARLVRNTPPTSPPSFVSPDIQLPEVLRDRLRRECLSKKEDCVWLNFLAQFLFSELRDTVTVRRFLTKRIQKEFEEFLTSRGGVFVDELFLRDFNLGANFPVFTEVCVDKCESKGEIIETLDIRTNMDYSGGFQIAIDAALPFGRMAYVSVQVVKLKGTARIRFTSSPFSHWSFVFYEEPEIDLDVSAQLDGRPMPKLRNIIANQIRRILRKKHTLPMYKLRYKPFFLSPSNQDLSKLKRTQLQINGCLVGSGILDVSIVEASKLPVINEGASLYCTVSVDDLPWLQLMTRDRMQHPVHTVEVIKNTSDQSLGLIIKDDFLPDRLSPVAVVQQVAIGSPSHLAGIKRGDIIVSVGGHKIMSAKQVIKYLRSGRDRVSIQLEKSGELGDQIMRSHSEENLRRRSELRTTNIDHGFVTVGPNPNVSKSYENTPAKKWTNRWTAVHRTTLQPAERNTRWNQKFSFSVDPRHMFLNVCVWSRGGDRSSKSDVMRSSSQDVLIGYLSQYLDDVYLHCLVTLNGTMKDKVKLKHGHYQTEAELLKEWVCHKGWDPNLMYGEMTLSFCFVPSLLSSQQRKNLTSCKSQHVRQLNQTEKDVVLESDQTSPPSQSISTKTPTIVSDPGANFTQGHHQFDSTNFVTATFCDYCGKKIWMKEAFKCRTCNMVCHKKCLVKCLVNTVCTDSGVKKRGVEQEKWQPLTNKSRNANVDSEDSAHKGHPEEDALELDPSLVDTMPSSRKSSTNETEALDLKEIPQGTSGRRIRALKEQTERMKDNVLKHIKKTRAPTTLNDKTVLAAKEVGMRLFPDLDLATRKDRLEELITKLDDELKLEMQHKEAIEKQISVVEDMEDDVPTQKRKVELKALEDMANKSLEKVDAMRLLMLQYCTGLQACINAIEQEASEKPEPAEVPVVVPTNKTEMGLEKTDVVDKAPLRSSYVGGFVKRASSSVKEKMSSIRKDFGKKAEKAKIVEKEEDNSEQHPSPTSRNSRLLNSILDGLSSKSMKSAEYLPLRKDDSRSGSEGELDLTISIPEVRPQNSQDLSPMSSHARSSSLATKPTFGPGRKESPSPLSSSYPPASKYPEIEIRVDYADKDVHPDSHLDADIEDFSEEEQLPNSSQMETKLARSNSDSRIGSKVMTNLSPARIIRSHGTSLPHLFNTDDEESDSDFLVVDSSDERCVSDSSEDEYDSKEFVAGLNGALAVTREDAEMKEEEADLEQTLEIQTNGTITLSTSEKDQNGNSNESDVADDEDEDEEDDEDSINQHRRSAQQQNSFVV